MFLVVWPSVVGRVVGESSALVTMIGYHLENVTVLRVKFNLPFVWSHPTHNIINLFGKALITTQSN